LACDLSSSELACAISELGKLKAIESVPAIIEVAEKSSLDCIIAAAKVFGDLKAPNALDFLLRCLSPGFLESKIRSPFDESKVDQARKTIIWAIKEIKKRNPESS
jgi:HEAT repeat protein